MKKGAVVSIPSLCVLIVMTVAAVPGALAQGKTPGGSGKPMILMSLANPAPIGAALTPLAFAQVAIGGGFSTIFTFLNTGTTPTTGSLLLNDDDGLPLNANLQEGLLPQENGINALGSSIPISIPPGGAQFITANPLTSGSPAQAGWALATTDGGSLSGVATFQLVDGGTLKTIAGVLGSDYVSIATIPVDDDAGSNRFTGYAVANPGTQDLNIKLVLVNADGTVAQTPSVPLLTPLHPGHHLARFLWQDLNNPNLKFKGSMVLIAQGSLKFSVVALVQNGGLFTAIPVIPSKAPHIN